MGCESSTCMRPPAPARWGELPARDVDLYERAAWGGAGFRQRACRVNRTQSVDCYARTPMQSLTHAIFGASDKTLTRERAAEGIGPNQRVGRLLCTTYGHSADAGCVSTLIVLGRRCRIERSIAPGPGHAREIDGGVETPPVVTLAAGPPLRACLLHRLLSWPETVYPSMLAMLAQAAWKMKRRSAVANRLHRVGRPWCQPLWTTQPAVSGQTRQSLADD